MAKVVPPGDLLAVVQALRDLMAAYDNAAFVVDGSLEAIDIDSEVLAKTLRPQLRDTSNGIFELLQQLEDLPKYKALRQAALKARRTHAS